MVLKIRYEERKNPENGLIIRFYIALRRFLLKTLRKTKISLISCGIYTNV